LKSSSKDYHAVMRNQGVRFSIAKYARWAPGLTTPEAWAEWAATPYPIGAGDEPRVDAMPAMLRRRAGFLGKMALEVAYQCVGGEVDIPTVFCSRHGEVARAVELLSDLAQGEPLSPTAFSMAVHNAIPGLFTIARRDRANHIALASGVATVEHGVIEACSLLADGVPQVLLVVCDCPLPQLFAAFDDEQEQPHAWAWLMTAGDAYGLEWTASAAPPLADMPGGLAVAAFHASAAAGLDRNDGRLCWSWSRNA
jgi:hypothetical protein